MWECMLQARTGWQSVENVVSNAVEHTDRARGIVVRLQMEVYEGQEYLTATVRDFGKGFSEQDLIYADQEFYSGDASRHDRTHQGLGLAIAKILKRAGRHALFLQPRGVWSGSGVPDQNGKDVIFAL